MQTESQVNEFIKTSDVKIEVEKKRPDMILGSQEEILSQLKALSDDNDIDEFMFHLPTAQADLRDKTIQTLAPIHTIHKEKAGIL